jgi:hypothetical protein
MVYFPALGLIARHKILEQLLKSRCGERQKLGEMERVLA